MTTNAANLLGVEKQRGSIKAGMFADIIATAENPLDNMGRSLSLLLIEELV